MLLMKYLIPVLIIGMLMGMSSGTMWLNQEPSYSLNQIQAASPIIKPANMTEMEIIQAPFFPSATASNSALGAETGMKPYAIGSTGNLSDIPATLSFSGGFENNMAYASQKSSLKVGQGEKWTNLNMPWIIM